MSEQLEQEVEQKVDLQALAEQGQEEGVEQQGEELPELSAVEQKAFDQGWRPEEDFSGPSENWKTPKEYIQAGEFMDQINALKGDMNKQQKSFDEQIVNVNKYNKAQTAAKIKELKAQQRESVELSDADGYDKAQLAIEDLQKEEIPEPAAQQTDSDIEDWNKKNPWFFEAGEKSNDAKAFYNSYTDANPNATISQALAYLDKKINQVYPSSNENPRRNQPNSTESKSRRPERKSKGLTMGDLTASESSDWNLFASDMFTEAEFLKTVADTRKIK